MSAADLFTTAAARTPRFTSSMGKRARVAFNVFQGENVRTITPAGRDAWALGELITAGAAGCTPIDNPGPRWSGYVFKLKRNYGLDIATITEGHDGPYAGHHARYVLRSRVDFADPADAARRGSDQ
jgi:hypothetical protein